MHAPICTFLGTLMRPELNKAEMGVTMLFLLTVFVTTYVFLTLSDVVRDYIVSRLK